jgi:hypothetical protein
MEGDAGRNEPSDSYVITIGIENGKHGCVGFRNSHEKANP